MLTVMRLVLTSLLSPQSPSNLVQTDLRLCQNGGGVHIGYVRLIGRCRIKNNPETPVLAIIIQAKSAQKKNVPGVIIFRC